MSYVGEICPYCGQQFDTGGQCGCMLRDRYSDPPAATFSFSTDSLGRIAAALERIADALEKQR